jgi:ribonuclease HI
MFCTIVTDAGFCPETKAAAWACWIVAENQRTQSSGVFKEGITNSADAEVKAILNAIYVARCRFPDISHIHVVTDCVYAMEIILKSHNHFDKYKEHVERMTKGIRLSSAHVKGHSRVRDKRSYCNRWCDETACE